MKATINFEQEARARVERLRDKDSTVPSPSALRDATSPSGRGEGCSASTPHPSPAVTPSPQGEGLSTDAEVAGGSRPAPNEEPEKERLQMPPALIPRHMSREEWKNMERAAAKGLLPDETVTPNRRMLYFTMLGLYAAVAAEVMPAEIAKVEKRMAIEAYNRISADAELFRSAGDFYKKVEQATTAYAKRASFDNAEAMYKAVLGAMPKNIHKEEGYKAGYAAGMVEAGILAVEAAQSAAGGENAE